MVRPVSKAKIKEWLEGGVEFGYALEKELDRVYKESAETFVSGNPTMTHEIKAKLVGREQLLLELIALFKQDQVEVFFNKHNDFIITDSEDELEDG